MGRTAREAVGYRELMDVVLGAIGEDEGWVRSLRATADLARKQRTFFRRDPRIRWIEWSPDLEERYRAVREAVTATCGS
jgi:tRNA dimethylallyltransferase